MRDTLSHGNPTAAAIRGHRRAHLLYGQLQRIARYDRLEAVGFYTCPRLVRCLKASSTLSGSGCYFSDSINLRRLFVPRLLL